MDLECAARSLFQGLFHGKTPCSRERAARHGWLGAWLPIRSIPAMGHFPFDRQWQADGGIVTVLIHISPVYLPSRGANYIRHADDLPG